MSQKSHDFPMIFPWSEAESCSQCVPFGSIRYVSTSRQICPTDRSGTTRQGPVPVPDSVRVGEMMGKYGKQVCFILFFFRFNYLISTQRRANEISWDWCESCLKRRACRVACPEAIPCLKSKARRQIARERRRALKLSGDFRGIFDPYSEWIELKIIWVCKKEMIRI